MRHSVKVGFSFGVTSGIITTLGLMVGLYSGTGSKLVVIGGILMIAIADAFSDALGIHVSEESEGKHSQKQIWESTFSTFFFKFIFASIFIIPFLIFEMKTGIIMGVILGLILLGVFSFKLSRKDSWKVVIEHLVIAVVVIAITYYLGEFVSRVFNT